MAVDVYSGLNAGLANLGQTYDDQRKFAMMQQAQNRANSLADLQVQQGKLKLSEMQRQYQDQSELRNSLANLQPTTSTVNVPNPMYGRPLDPGLAQSQADNEGEWTPSAVAVMRQAQGLSDQPTTENQQPTIQQTVTIPANPIDTIVAHAMKTGAYDEAKKAIDMQTLIRNSSPDKLKQAEQLKDLATFTGALKHMKELKQSGVMTQSLLDGLFSMMPDTIKAQMPGGLQLQDISSDGGLEVKDAQGNVIAHWAVSPDGTKTELVKMSDKDKEVWGEPYESRVGGKIVMLQKSSTNQIKPVVQDTSTTSKITINNGGGNDDDVQAWAKAVKEGRANLQDVPNRGTVRSRVVKELEKQGGVDYAANNAENKASAASITQQQKQLGSMGSFVKNLNAQIGQVESLSKDLQTFDTRLLNVPLRTLRGRVAGSPLQAKYDMYLAEISSEIGKLASGSTGSVAELSQGAREKWDKIHDPNLSVKDMISLLQETRNAATLRVKSVEDTLSETKANMRNRGGARPPAGAKTKSDPLGIL